MRQTCDKKNMRNAQLKIRKEVKHGTPYYVVSAPPSLSASKKYTRHYFRTKAEAERKRAELLAAIRNNTGPVLTEEQIADAHAALALLAENNLTANLVQAIKQALPILTQQGCNITVEDLIERFISARSAAWRPSTTRNFRAVADKFLSSHSTLMLTELTPAVLSAWLYTSTPAMAAFNVRTIKPAFSFAVRQGMLDSNPFTKVELAKPKQREAIDIFTPAEARNLLNAAPADCKAAYAILLFAGVRPNELTLLTWSDIREGYIHISPSIAKTAQVRNVEIEPNLAAWLNAYRLQPTEPICPANWRRKNRATRAAANLLGRQDTARHSYATYYLQKYKNKAALEENMGHMAGSAVLMRHYRAASTPEDAQSYWSIYPENKNGAE